MAEAKKTAPNVEEEYVPELVTISVKLRGKNREFEMFQDPMDAASEVMEAGEKGNFMTFVRGLMTDTSRHTAEMMKLTARELIEVIMPAYNEATGQGED